jgi:hypothetical protein
MGMQLPEKIIQGELRRFERGPVVGEVMGGGGGVARGGFVTKSRRSFFDFTSHEKQNFIFTIFRNTEA